ncbi:MAG: phosphoribosylglycinamide formyltransferase [Chitinophagales bacterium]|nr:phosphoribosylglycinamide formyltransferase [Chitinophagales bacterium]
MCSKLKIAIAISGAGSNARAIIKYFKNHEKIEVALLISNQQTSGAEKISQDTGVPYFIFNRENFYKKDTIIKLLEKYEIQGLILAGFLWLIPENLIQKFPRSIINIHPALLPKYGGKGMYGMKVHQAVKDAREEETGITIHLVNQEYDKGEVLLQEKVKIESSDTPEDIAQKVHQLEYAFFAPTIEKYFLAITDYPVY